MAEFKYNIHVHTCESSPCGQVPGRELVHIYKNGGYAGLIITDHFKSDALPLGENAPWREQIDALRRGYLAARDEGERIGIQVLFAFEYTYEDADYLVYNAPVDFLYESESFDKWRITDFFDRMHKAGALIIHAHPMRERPYIRGMHLYPDYVDGVEVFNGSHRKTPQLRRFDERAELYAADHPWLLKTAGSDNHTRQNRPGALIFDSELASVSDFVTRMRERRYTVCRTF